MTTKKQNQPIPRVRFDLGFYDGQFDAYLGKTERPMGTHFDPVYAQGYTTGFSHYQEMGKWCSSSKTAWLLAQHLSLDDSSEHR